MQSLLASNKCDRLVLLDNNIASLLRDWLRMFPSNNTNRSPDLEGNSVDSHWLQAPMIPRNISRLVMYLPRVQWCSVSEISISLGPSFEIFAEFSEYFKVYDTAGILRYKYQTTTLYNLEYCRVSAKANSQIQIPQKKSGFYLWNSKWKWTCESGIMNPTIFIDLFLLWRKGKGQHIQFNNNWKLKLHDKWHCRVL